MAITMKQQPVRYQWTAVLLSVLLLSLSAWAQTKCQQTDLAVQILGSGGPIAEGGRAGSSALVWVDGKARMLVDAGGGAFVRFGESGARIEDLHLIALTHFHADHVVDLPALLQSSTFSDRTRELQISGPSGDYIFPGLDRFLDALFDAERGAFRYLAEPGFEIERLTVAENAETAVEVLDHANLQVDAIGVPHGAVPALAYRVRVGETVIVFSGDQNGRQDHFWQFAERADLLVMNQVIAEDANDRMLSRHAPPSVIGRGAARAKVDRMLLTHLMQRSGPPEQARQLIRESFEGEILFAEDLMCVPLVN